MLLMYLFRSVCVQSALLNALRDCIPPPAGYLRVFIGGDEPTLSRASSVSEILWERDILRARYIMQKLIACPYSINNGTDMCIVLCKFFSCYITIAGFQSIPWDSEDKDTVAILVGRYNSILFNNIILYLPTNMVAVTSRATQQWCQFNICVWCQCCISYRRFS